MRQELSWLDDPRIFRVRGLDPHSDHHIYAGEEDLAAGSSRLIQSLNGPWAFRYLPAPCIPEGFGDEDFDIRDFDTLTVPGHIELAGYHQIQYTNSDYPWEGRIHRRPLGTGVECEAHLHTFAEGEDNPTGLYVREFDYVPLSEGEGALLRLEGAEQAVCVWVNGCFAGYGEDSFTPSEFDVTSMVRPGKNRVSIAVFRHCSASYCEDQDFFRFFGLFRDVKLVHIPRHHLRDIHVITSVDPETRLGTLGARLKLTGSGPVHVEMILKDPAGKAICRRQEPAEEEQLSPEEVTLQGVALWDYRTPALYTLEVRLTDEKGLCEISSLRVGFRRIEIRDKVIYMNGRRLLLCGVNRHEWSAEKGRAIGEEEMLSDIRCILDNNMNAVRTCHYPNQVRWYELCDEAGIYVMAETNLESHGSWQKWGIPVERSWNVPGSFDAWREAMLDRCAANYEMLKNHASVLFWSLGNEACAGEVLCDMNAYYKEKDPSRLTHYESVCHAPEFRDRISDVESRMYAPPARIREYLEDDPDKPFLLCEFMHDMGNSLGGLKEYMELFDACDMYQGGFIWDMIDQALWAEDEITGRPVLRYGGDFDERHSDLEFSGNGLLFADRAGKPALQEVKALYGRYLGIPGVMPEPAAPPRQEKAAAAAAAEAEAETMDLVFGDSALGVRGSRLEWMFSYCFGGPESLRINGTEWLWRAPRPAFWRATTCNDRGNGFSRRSAQWMGADMFTTVTGFEIFRDGVPVDASAVANNSLGGEQKARNAEIVYHFLTATQPPARVDVSYHLSGGGECRVTVNYHGEKGLPQLPVLGFRLVAPTGADGFRYEGLSGETYPDRMNGGVPGIYEVEGLPVTPYLVPQECGMHMGTRWVEIHRSTCLNNAVDRKADTTLKITMDPEPLGFSCLPYTPQELENAFHMEELPPARRTVLTVAGRVRGVGGINSWGADVDPACQLSAEEDYSFSFLIGTV